jgi:hypothetical protein
MVDDQRFYEIDIQVEDSGHRYNPNTDRFEATVGSDADANLDHDLKSFTSALVDVSEDELRKYASRKSKEADDAFRSDEADRTIEEMEREQARDEGDR